MVKLLPNRPGRGLTQQDQLRNFLYNTARPSASRDVRAGFLFFGRNVNLYQALFELPAATCIAQGSGTRD